MPPDDPITLQLIHQRLISIVKEMQQNVFRTGFSTAIRESQDASCAILDADGRVIGEHVVLPLHMGSFPEIIRALYRRFPREEIRPGDAFITNHPYECGLPHSPDMATVTPVFCEGRLVAFCANIAHKTDMGGIGPGGGSAQSREIFHEGTLVPIVRWERDYEVLPEVEVLLRANSRTPDLIVGDIRGQVGTNRMGEERLAALFAKYGVDRVLAASREMLEKTERRVRQALAEWPDGTYEAEGFLDHDGVDLSRPIRVHVAVTKEGDRIRFDFSGSDPEAVGPANIRPPLVQACCAYALIAFIDPNLPNNGGLARVIETAFAERSLLNPRFPAPVNNYMPVANLTIEVVLAALAQIAPERAIAFAGGDGGIILNGATEAGDPYVFYEIQGSSYGARFGKDGVSGVTVYAGNCRITPIEIVESEFPVRFRRFELRRDSGGPGRWRGGLGFVREFELLGPPARFSLRGGRHVLPPPGLFGGEPGGLGRCLINPGSPDEVSLPSRVGGYPLQTGDVVSVQKAGGGGYGDPRERDRARVIDDVLDGYVSPETARERYGVDVGAEAAEAAQAAEAAPPADAG